jgi:hypothetical protein
MRKPNLFSRRPLIALPRDGQPIAGSDSDYIRISFGDATYGVFVVGGTGAGKTESIMRPALSELLTHGCAGLVLDVKGDYSSMCREEFSDRTVIVGTSEGATPVNLLAGMTADRFRQVLAGFTDEMRNSTTNSNYFAAMGADAAYLIFLFVRLGLEREPTLADIAFYLTRPRDFCRDLLRAEDSGARLPPVLAEEIRQQSGNPFSILAVSGYLVRDPGYPTDKTQVEQFAWASNYLRTALGPFASNPILRQQFSASAALDFGRLLYVEGRTVVLDCPQARYGAVSSAVSRLLRLQFQDAIRLSSAATRERAGIGSTRYSFLLADEYQVHISGRNGGEVFADADWFSTSRSYGHINIVATQGLSMLYARTDRATVDAVVQNCRSKIFLGVEDEASLDLASLLGLDQADSVRRQLLYSSGLGTGFVYVKHCSAEGGRTVAARFACRPDTDYAFMGRYIGRDFDPLPAIDENDHQGAPFILAARPSGDVKTATPPVQPQTASMEWVCELLAPQSPPSAKPDGPDVHVVPGSDATGSRD